MSKKEPVIDRLTIWTHYGQEHGMSYGQVRAAVECGLLPPPDLTKMPEKKPLEEPKSSAPVVIEDQMPRKWREPNAKCVVCGTPFFTLGRVKTCSNQACKVALHRKQAKERARAQRSRNRRPGRFGPGICVVCGKEYQKFRPSSVCCCEACTKVYHKWSIQRRQQAKEAVKGVVSHE